MLSMSTRTEAIKLLSSKQQTFIDETMMNYQISKDNKDANLIYKTVNRVGTSMIWRPSSVLFIIESGNLSVSI